MDVGASQVRIGDNPSIGPVVVELGGIPTMESSDVTYLRDILCRLSRMEHKLDLLITQTSPLSLWERIKRWLGIH